MTAENETEIVPLVATGWVAVACQVADVIRHEKHVSPFASSTDMSDDTEALIFTEWGVTYPSGSTAPILREYRWPNDESRDCEHLVPIALTPGEVL